MFLFVVYLQAWQEEEKQCAMSNECRNAQCPPMLMMKINDSD